MTIASIVQRGKGTAHAWRVHRWQPANGGACATLYHYSTAMLTWRVDHPDDPAVLAWSEGWGSVSDQNGMNTAFKLLGLPYRYDRDARGGGPRITELRRHPCGCVTDPRIAQCTCARALELLTGMERDSAPERRTVDVPYSEAAMHCGIAGMTLEAVEEATYVNGRTIPREERHGCYVITASGARLPMLKSEAGWLNVT